MSRSATAFIAVLVCCLSASVLTVSASAAVVVHFEHESFKDFKRQLERREIHAVAFNKKAHSMHLSLNDGSHMLVSYPSSEVHQLIAELQAKGISVKIQRSKPKPKPVHHKLRYIAGGALILLIAIVLVVLMLGRRRMLSEQAKAGQSSTDSQAET